MLVKSNPTRKSYFLLNAEVEVVNKDATYTLCNVTDVMCIWDWDRSTRSQAEMKAVTSYLSRHLTSIYSIISISSSPYVIPEPTVKPS
jgi:hypothetical protein